MRVVLGRALLVALTLWSWFALASLCSNLAHPVSPLIGGNETLFIDRHGPDDTRVGEITGASDFRPGDRFSAASLSLDERLLLYSYQVAGPTDHVDIRILRDGVRQTIAVRARPVNLLATWRPIDLALSIVESVLGALTMTATCWLALVRPSVLTRALFLGFFGSLIGSPDLRFTPLWPPGLLAFLIATLGWGFVEWCAWESVRAATRFPDDRPGPQTSTVLGLAAVLAAFAAAWAIFRNSAGVLYPIGAVPDWLVSDSPSSLGRSAFIAALIGLNALAAAALVVRYRAATAEDRLKIRAVLIAVGVNALQSAFGWLVFTLVPFHHETTPLDELVRWSGLVVYLLPLTVIAAVLRHRLFGIRFVLNRALVYGGIALLLVAPLRLVNLLLAARFPHTRVALVAEAAVALVLAVAFDPLRRAVERFVRAAMFRKHAQTIATLGGLTAAALDAPDTGELRELAARAAGALDLDRAVLQLDGAPPARATEIPTEVARTYPLRIGSVEAGRLVFGAHRSGADFDPEESRALAAFAAAVEAALQRLETDRLQAEVAELRLRLGADARSTA